MKLALVTGGGAGIGAAIAQALLAAGYRVAIADVNATSISELVASHENLTGHLADVSDAAAVSGLFDAIGDVPDLVVNNAGIVRFGQLGELSVEDFRQVVDINLIGVFAMTREAVRRMVPRGSGHVVSLTSINAYSPGPGAGAYPATKSAVLQLMKQFALEYGVNGLRFNSVAPGFIDGGMSAPIYADPKVRASRTGGVPLARLGSPEDIANAICFLDSEAGSYINAHDLVIDGGVTHAVLKNLPRGNE
jgi:3-oxoacyl-[acyl-carrier protein] reductase